MYDKIDLQHSTRIGFFWGFVAATGFWAVMLYTLAQVGIWLNY